MYKQFYGLRDKPFTLTPDTNYLYMGRNQQEALHCLASGTTSGSRLIILTGEIGSGKTVLLRNFVKELDPAFHVIHVFYPTSSCIQLLQMVLLNMGVKTGHDNLKVLREELKKQLKKSLRKKKKSLLIIDEAQNLDADALAETVRLAGLKHRNERLLTVILVGLPKLKEKLSAHFRAGSEDVSSYHLGNLSKEDVPHYIRYRLTTAGCCNFSIFPDEIMDEVSVCSGGIPRVINMMCESLLLQGYASHEKIITRPVLQKVLASSFCEISREHQVMSEPLQTGCERPDRRSDINEKQSGTLEETDDALQKTYDQKLSMCNDETKESPASLPLRVIVLDKNARIRVHIENALKKNGYDTMVTGSIETLSQTLEKPAGCELHIVVADVTFFFSEAGKEDREGTTVLDNMLSAYAHVPFIMTSTISLTALQKKLVRKGLPFLLKKPDLDHTDMSEINTRINKFTDELNDVIEHLYLQFDAFYKGVIKWFHEQDRFHNILEKATG